MAGIYPQDLVKALLESDAGGVDLASLQRAQATWNTVAGSMRSRLDGTGDKANPGLLDRMKALQEPTDGTWSGAAADSFLDNVKSVYTFGDSVRGSLQTTPRTSTANSWADIADTLHTTLQGASARYNDVTDSYNNWLNGVAKNVQQYDTEATNWAMLGSYWHNPANIPPMPVDPGKGGTDGYTITTTAIWNVPNRYRIQLANGEVAEGGYDDLTNPQYLAKTLKTTYFQNQYDDILGNLAGTYDTVRSSVPTPVSTKDLPKVDQGNPNRQQLPTNPGVNLTGLSGSSGLNGAGPGSAGLPATLGGTNTSGLGRDALDKLTTPGTNTPGLTQEPTTSPTNTPSPASALNGAQSALSALQNGVQGLNTPGLNTPGLNTSGLGSTDPSTSLAGFNPGGLDSSALGLTPATGGGVNTPGLSDASTLGLSPVTSGLGGAALNGSGLGGSGLGGSGLGGAGLGTSGLGTLGLSGAGVNTPGVGASTGSGTGGGSGAEEIAGNPDVSATAPGALAGEAAVGEAAAGGRMPYMPPMSPMGMGNNAQDRQRKAWLPDDEDVWGAQTSVVPGVLDGT